MTKHGFILGLSTLVLIGVLVIGAMLDFFGVLAGESSRFSLTITAGALLL